MRQALRQTIAMLALAALAGCGHSAPTHLLTLDAAPPAGPSSTYAGPPVRLTAVLMPSAIDRLEFASAVSSTELQIADQYHWSASLGSLARGALLRDLAARLPEGSVLPPDSPAGKATRRVDVAVLALGTGAQRNTMEAIITIATDGTAQVLRQQRSLYRDHAPGQNPALAAQDYSAMLGDLADQIATMLLQMPPVPAPTGSNVGAPTALPASHHPALNTRGAP